MSMFRPGLCTTLAVQKCSPESSFSKIAPTLAFCSLRRGVYASPAPAGAVAAGSWSSGSCPASPDLPKLLRSPFPLCVAASSVAYPTMAAAPRTTSVKGRMDFLASGRTGSLSVRAADYGPVQREAPVTIQRPERVRSQSVSMRTVIISAIAHHRAVRPPPRAGTASATGANRASVTTIAQAR